MKTWLGIAALAGALAYPQAALAAPCTTAFNTGAMGALDCTANDGLGHEVHGICKYASSAQPGTAGTLLLSGVALTTQTHMVKATRLDCEVYDAAGVVVASADSGVVAGAVATAQTSSNVAWSPYFTLCLFAEGWYSDGHYISVGTFCV
jgi:hypothetical protein